MTAFVPTASDIGPGTIFTSVAAGDSVTFLQPYSFINTTGTAVNINHANNTLINMTTLMSGASNGVFVNTVADCDIINTATGTIAALTGALGFSAIHLSGDRNSLLNAGDVYSVNGIGVYQLGIGSVIDNSGRIQGGIRGVAAYGTDYSILNSGTIESGTGTESTAVALAGFGSDKSLINTGVIQSLSAIGGTAVRVGAAGQTTIDNSGSILSVGGIAIEAVTATGSLHLTNSGTISSATSFTFSVFATAQSDIILNTGSIDGSVDLGGGNDLFDGIGGFVGGTVYGGAGNDTFRVSDALAAIFEFALEGTLDRIESTVSFSLATTGEVENLTLLGTATDGIGNGLANLIQGNLQGNILRGRDGNDTLNGGDADDSLNGDTANDLVRGESGDDSLRGGVAGDTLYGGDDDDLLRGDAGIDGLYGENGEDVLHGGANRDWMYGGADADTFLFRFVADSAAGAAIRDIITGFETGLDLIDLRQIDANSLLTTNQAFTWIGTAAFSNIAGQLRLITGANSVLQGDVNGDGVADFELQFNTLATVSVNDILL